MLKVGTKLRDNDPRVGGTELMIARIEGEHAICYRGGKRTVKIQLKRIHCDGKPRRTGFSVVEAAK
jgi:hypothetical protein